jgi:alpha-tubulin suppressor-like RCC1 family protein
MAKDGHDLTDAKYFYVPRPLEHLYSFGVRATQVSCGSHFTVATAADGSVYSWYALPRGAHFSHFSYSLGAGMHLEYSEEELAMFRRSLPELMPCNT